MVSFILVPGAGGMASYWHRVVPLIRAAGHEAIAIDLPGDDRHAGLAAYADIIIRAIAERSGVVLVAHSLAGFTAPLVCARAPVRTLVFVNAMIPRPGETAGAWWGATGAVEAREQAAARGGYATDFDQATYFLHDVPEDVLRTGPQQPREEAEIVFGEPCNSTAGRTSPFVLWLEEMTDFSRSNFSGVSRVKGSERKWTKSLAVISSRCQIRKG